MNTIIKQNNKKVIFSNRICCASEETLVIEHQFDFNDILKIEFNFLKNEKKEQNININTIGQNRIIFNCSNMNNPLGVGIKEPLNIARFNDKEIYVVFFLYRITECNHIVDITLYMEE